MIKTIDPSPLFTPFPLSPFWGFVFGMPPTTLTESCFANLVLAAWDMIGEQELTIGVCYCCVVPPASLFVPPPSCAHEPRYAFPCGRSDWEDCWCRGRAQAVNLIP